jgi:protein-S-isoprenylcysteine O-methyltransferase Ste14
LAECISIASIGILSVNEDYSLIPSHLVGGKQQNFIKDPHGNPGKLQCGMVFLFIIGTTIKGVWRFMLTVFATNQIALYLFGISSAIWIVLELFFAVTRNRAQGAQTQDRASGMFLIVCLYAGIFLGLNTSFSARQFAIPWNRTLLFGIGIFFILAGEAFRWYAISVLEKFFTTVIAIQPGHTVIEKGPYHYIRHPSYSGAILSFLGFGLALTNWLSFGLVLLGTALGYGYRVNIEERALIDGLGQPYRDYMQRTKRFIPFVY